MAAPKREPSIRVRLDGSQDAVIARSGVHLMMGRANWFVSDRAMNSLVEEWARRRETFDAIDDALRPAKSGTARESD